MKEKPLISKLNAGERAIVFAEANTGILLTPQGERHTGQSQCYMVFGSESEAIAFARAYVDKHPAIECSLRDENGNHLQFIRKR